MSNTDLQWSLKRHIIQAMTLTVAELAHKAGLTARYVRQEIASGRLAARRAGGVWLIADDDAQVWLLSPRRGSRRRGSRSKSSKRGVDADSKSGNL